MANPNESDPIEVSITPVSDAAPSVPTELLREGDNFLQPVFVFTNAQPVNAGADLTYTVQVSTLSDFSNVTAVVSDLTEDFGDVGVGQTGWTIDRELEEDATYFWRVRAVEGSLLGAFSEAQEFIAELVILLPGDFGDNGIVNLFDFFEFVGHSTRW